MGKHIILDEINTLLFHEARKKYVSLFVSENPTSNKILKKVLEDFLK